MTDDPDHFASRPRQDLEGNERTSANFDPGAVETFRADLPKPRRPKPRKTKVRPRGWRFWLGTITGALLLATVAALLSGYAFVKAQYLPRPRHPVL